MKIQSKIEFNIKTVEKIDTKKIDLKWVGVRKESDKKTTFKLYSFESMTAFNQLVKKMENPFEIKGKNNQEITFHDDFTTIIEILPKGLFEEKDTAEKIILLTNLAAKISRQLSGEKSLVIDFTTLRRLAKDLNLPAETVWGAWVEGLFLGRYEFTPYKDITEPVKKSTKKDILLLLSPTDKKSFDNVANKIITEKKVVAEAVFAARDLVNHPPNILNTQSYWGWLKGEMKTLKASNVKLSVLGQAELKAKKMNAILAVNAGSKKEAKLFELEYTPKNFPKNGKTVLLVGKGVTFDSGGLSLKPSKAMEDMKMDMAGSAAVISAFLAISKLGLSSRVVAITPITDNMTGGDAFKVGDVITTYSGKTVEVLNTDAEGRLILADALSYGVEKYNADYVVDLATLTGACLVALGIYYAGLFSTSENLSKQLLASSKATGDRLWPLPLNEFYLKELESSIADLKNIGSGYGGAITAAKFLEQFVCAPKSKKKEDKKNKEISWAHLDIAPTMLADKTSGADTKGATGFGVRLLVDFVKNLSK